MLMVLADRRYVLSTSNAPTNIAMIRVPTLAITFGLLWVAAPLAWGQRQSSLASAFLLERYGLVRAWHAQVELDSAQARVVHVTQHVSQTQAMTVIDVVLVDNEKQKLATYTDRQLDAFGRPLGVEGAKKAAEERIAELQVIGVAAKAITTVVPDITLYITTNNGFMHAIDGETGATRWVVPVGRSDHPTFSPAANDHFVAAINGIYLYVFDAKDGRLAWSRRLTHAAGAGPAVTQEFVHVPMVPGLIESYHLLDPSGRPRVYQSFGRATLQPTVSPNSLIWATDRGFLYVGNGDAPGVRFRLETLDEITARPAWLAPNQVMAVSRDGDVYVMNEFTGALMWRFSTGDPIDHSPVPIDDDVYIITTNYTMFRLSAQTGGAGAGAIWSTQGLSKIVSASATRLYCLDPTGRLVILDRATGGRVATLPTNFREVDVLNNQTDRLFFVSYSGLVQCFREFHQEYPLVHAGPGTEAQQPKQVQQQPLAAPAKPAPDALAPANPFGEAADPFADPAGGDAAPADEPETEAPADDPFGAADPFGD